MAASVISGTFVQPTEVTAEIKVTIETDKNVVEHVWRLLDDDGNVIVNDPYSVVRSSKTWSAEDIASEALVMFSYRAL